jgi:hypothetical protein
VKSLREQAGSPPVPPAAGLPPTRSAA